MKTRKEYNNFKTLNINFVNQKMNPMIFNNDNNVFLTFIVFKYETEVFYDMRNIL